MPTAASRPIPRPTKSIPTPAPRPENLLNIPNDYKPEKIAGAFDDKYIKYESENNEKLTIKKYLEILDHIYHCTKNEVFH